MKICAFEGCGRDTYGHIEVCHSHYAQRRRGRPMTPLRPPSGSVPLAERFWPNVQKTDGCWEWIAGKSKSGYGSLNVAGKRRRAHTVSYEMVNGPVPDGLYLDHVCRNRGCVRPDHLRPVTHKQNMEHRDKAATKSLPLGVSRYQKTGKYRARVMHYGVVYFLGQYDTPEEAGAVAAAKRNELFTHNDLDRKTA